MLRIPGRAAGTVVPKAARTMAWRESSGFSPAWAGWQRRREKRKRAQTEWMKLCIINLIVSGPEKKNPGPIDALIRDSLVIRIIAMPSVHEA